MSHFFKVIENKQEIKPFKVFSLSTDEITLANMPHYFRTELMYATLWLTFISTLVHFYNKLLQALGAI